MPRLKLILGPPGSGKTEAVLREAAALAAASPLEGAPLLVIVPEQQAVQTERALLARLEAQRDAAERSGQRATNGAADAAVGGTRPVAVSRLRVMSLTRLASVLAEAAGETHTIPGELGRRLLLWRLLARVEESEDISGPLSLWATGRENRTANTELLSELLAELAQRGAGAAELSGAAQRLAAQTGSMAGQKLSALAAFQRLYEDECAARGLAFAAPAARIPELLSEAHWPGLAGTQVWVDGFADFTPPEEQALKALLLRCQSLTATLLLDRQRREGPAPQDVYDCYVPTREQYRRWLALSAGMQMEEEWLESLPRWRAGVALAAIAAQGLSGEPAESAEPQAGQRVTDSQASAYVCADERAEVDKAAAEIIALVQGGLNGRPLRYGEISVVTRSLSPYAELIRARFADCAIHCFIDQRRSLAQHPAVELLRCGLRLALDCAQDDDVYTLLKCGLLPAAETSTESEGEEPDELEDYARGHGLKPWHWLEEQPWRRWRRLLRRDDDEGRKQAQEEQIAARLAQLDSWRRRLLAPVQQLRQTLDAASGAAHLGLGDTLAAAWSCLFDDTCQSRLSAWADAEPDPEIAELHREVLPAIAGLFDEFAAQAEGLRLQWRGHPAAAESAVTEGALTAAEFCAWLESGLGSLSLGFPPPRLDSVLVTEVERGRHHPVRASILLGLAEDSWPPAASDSPFFTAPERLAANTALSAGQPGVLPLRIFGGAQDKAAREPYLALVAATRASERLLLLRPGADSTGRRRPASPYCSLLTGSLGLAEETFDAQKQLLPLATEIIAQAALRPADEQLGRLAAQLAGSARVAWAARGWGLAQARQGSRLPRLPAELLTRLYGGKPGQLQLACSVSRLETFASCPFKHFAHYNLRLAEAEETAFGAAELGGFYHSLFDRLVRRMNETGYDWLAGDAQQLADSAREELKQAGAELLGETGRESAAYILERAGLLLEHHIVALREQLALSQRRPQFTELAFGRHGAFPPLLLEVAGGALRLSGYLDRLDVDAAGGATVVDYKLGGAAISWGRFLCGAQIQLFAYLLAVDGVSVARLDGSGRVSLHPAGGELQRVEPRWKDDQGQFSAEGIVGSFQTEAKQAALAELLPNALAQTRRILAELGSRILAGEIRPLPLREFTGPGTTACAYCSYRPVCRFDPAAGDQYHDARREGSAKLRDALAAGEAFVGSALPPGEAAP